MFVPLSHPPGHAQCDSGEALVVIGGAERKAHCFVIDLPHSDGCFIKAYPAETTEAFLDGHVSAFAFLGGVPQSVLYDNTKLAVARILGDGRRQRLDRDPVPLPVRGPVRALAGETGIDSHRIRLGLYTQSQEQLIINAIGELSQLPIYIDDTPYQGMVEIRGKARRLDLDRGLDLIMVDYLQLVQGQLRGGPVNRVQEIPEISRVLKVMAGELNTAVIACSQMSRMVENRPSHRPQLSELRDSGSIEQDADIVAFIHREDLYTTEEEWSQTHPGQEYPRNIAEIIVAKNRKGPTGSIRLEFRDHLVRFDSVARSRAA